LPMAEHYVRTANLGLARYCRELHTPTAAHFHGTLNELAFRLFSLANEQECLPDALDESVIAQQLDETLSFISSFRQHGRGQLSRPGAAELRDAVELASRILQFFRSAAPDQKLTTRPTFKGC